MSVKFLLNTVTMRMSLRIPISPFGKRPKNLLDKDKLPNGGWLVIHWSGHGELVEIASLNLVIHDTIPDAPANLSPEYLAELSANTGASQIC